MALSAARNQRIKRQAKEAERLRMHAKDPERCGLPPEPERER